MPSEIQDPLRILILSNPDCPIPPFLQDLESYKVSTAYYSAQIPLWRDDLPLTAPVLSTWATEWSQVEAEEVVNSIGAIVLCFRRPVNQHELNDIKASLQTIASTISSHQPRTDPLLFAVKSAVAACSVPAVDFMADEWEDVCREAGNWEYIDGAIAQGQEAGGRNEFGEKVGLERLKEALEAGDWEGDEYDGGLDEAEMDGQSEDEDGTSMDKGVLKDMKSGLLRDKSLDELTQEREVPGGSKDGAETDADDEEEVQMLEAMMLRLQAARDMGADMPLAERKRFAAKAVGKVMETL